VRGQREHIPPKKKHTHKGTKYTRNTNLLALKQDQRGVGVNGQGGGGTREKKKRREKFKA
jgi:hypothetical protein